MSDQLQRARLHLEALDAAARDAGEALSRAIQAFEHLGTLRGRSHAVIKDAVGERGVSGAQGDAIATGLVSDESAFARILVDCLNGTVLGATMARAMGFLRRQNSAAGDFSAAMRSGHHSVRDVIETIFRTDAHDRRIASSQRPRRNGDDPFPPMAA